MAEQRIDTVRLQNLAYGYRQSATLLAAIELDLFTKVSGGANTIETLATAADITLANAERIAVGCLAMGLIEKHGGVFRNAPDVERFLVKGARTYAGPWLTTMGRSDYAQWNRLAEFLRIKEPPHVLGTYENFTVEDARKLHAATFSIGMGAGRLFSRQVDLSRRSLILDLGGGSGCYCIAAAQKYPRIRGIVFDLPSVVVVAREYIAREGFSDRITATPGDFTADPFPRGGDVAILASNLPQYSPELIRKVVSKAFSALQGGGEMHVIGEMLDDDRTGPLGPALWALNEAIYKSTGVAHSRADTMGYLREAGFVEVDAHEFIPGSLVRVCGVKPH